MRRFAVLFLSVLIVLSATGCRKKPAAVVNGEEISRKVLEWNLNLRISEHRARGAAINEPALRSAVTDQLVGAKLLAQGASKEGLSVTPDEVEAEVRRITQRLGEEEFKKSLRRVSMSMDEFNQMVRGNLLADKFALSLASEEDITDAEVEKFYKESPTPFLQPESVLIRFIQTATREQADDIMKELKEKNITFDKLADRLAENKAATVSGYSWATPAFFRDEIARALVSIEKGRYGGPFKAKDGYFIFMIKDRQHERAKTLEEAKGDIRKMLLAQRRESALAHWLAETRKAAEVVIN